MDRMCKNISIILIYNTFVGITYWIFYKCKDPNNKNTAYIVILWDFTSSGATLTSSDFSFLWFHDGI
jgi:formate/nitrite transporter FocA (FNT family)